MHSSKAARRRSPWATSRCDFTRLCIITTIIVALRLFVVAADAQDGVCSAEAADLEGDCAGVAPAEDHDAAAVGSGHEDVQLEDLQSMRVQAVHGGTLVLASSVRTEFVEGNYYFPPDDVHTLKFAGSDLTTHCPWKGDATYHTLVLRDGQRLDNVAWSYEAPTEQAQHIRGYWAFYTGRNGITVEPV